MVECQRDLNRSELVIYAIPPTSNYILMDAKYTFRLIWSGGIVYLYNTSRSYVLVREGELYSISDRNGKEKSRIFSIQEMKTFLETIFGTEIWNMNATSNSLLHPQATLIKMLNHKK